MRPPSACAPEPAPRRRQERSGRKRARGQVGGPQRGCCRGFYPPVEGARHDAGGTRTARRRAHVSHPLRRRRSRRRPLRRRDLSLARQRRTRSRPDRRDETEGPAQGARHDPAVEGGREHAARPRRDHHRNGGQAAPPTARVRKPTAPTQAGGFVPAMRRAPAQ